MFNKKGVDAVVATVLIIMITVAAAAVIWAFVVPMIKDSAVSSTQETAKLSIETSGGYTTWDEVQKIARVQIKRGNDNVNLTGLDFNFIKQGNSTKNQTEIVPQPNQMKVYEFNLSDFGKPEKVTVAPITASGVGSIVSESNVVKDYSGSTEGVQNQVSCVSGLNSEGNIIICTCEDLQNMNQNLGVSYILGRDIDCSGRSISSLGKDYCLNSYCTSESSCTTEIGCGGTWSSCSWDDGSNVCDWDSDYCENTCEGVFNYSTNLCDGVGPKYCSDSQTVCEGACESEWYETSGCLTANLLTIPFGMPEFTDRCTEEVSCEREIGCNSQWIDSQDSFTGVFDGKGNSIVNLTIIDGALFKRINSTGIVKDLIFENVVVNGEDSYNQGGIYFLKGNAATITLWNEGMIENIGVIGTITGLNNFARAAGIAVTNYGNISSVFSKGTISGSGWYGQAAGIVVENYATGLINNTYSVSSLSGYAQGGIVSSNSQNLPADPLPIVSNSYFSGSYEGEEPISVVRETSSGIVLNSFVAPTTNLEDYFGIEGIPFSQLGWSTAIWSPQDSDYPKLVWEINSQ